jgi:serpin B
MDAESRDSTGPEDAGPLTDVRAADDGPSLKVQKSNEVRTAASSAISQGVLNAAVAANNAFAVHLYSQVNSSAAGNLLTSPVSASLALTMAYAGAGGQTATQMADVLQFGEDAGTSIFDGQNALSQALAGRGAAELMDATQAGTPDASASDYELQVVNSVWGEQSYTWAAPFLSIMATSYGAGVYLEDFINHPDEARLAINSWVSSSTDGKIIDLLPQPAVDAHTRLVLVNAIHLKFPWANPFLTARTANGTFTREDATTVSPSFMNQTGILSYQDDGQAQIASLSLSGGQLSVVIALPHPDVKLATYEASLHAGSPALAPPPSTSLVALSLPKVTFTSPSFSLKTSLQAMGMTQAFIDQIADFSGLAPPNALSISDVLQKATISMQESGVEAAAATAVIFADGGSEPPEAAAPIPMTVNRPYLVTVVDVPTGAILFLGHIEDPTSPGGP